MSDKVQFTVFMPVGMCSCSQTGFLGRINEAVSKYRAILEYRQDSAGSEEALRLGIKYRAVKVGNRLLKSNPTSTQIENAILSEVERLQIKVSEAI